MLLVSLIVDLYLNELLVLELSWDSNIQGISKVWSWGRDSPVAVVISKSDGSHNNPFDINSNNIEIDLGNIIIMDLHIVGGDTKISLIWKINSDVQSNMLRVDLISVTV